MKSFTLKEGLESAIPFRSIAWGGQATRGAIEAWLVSKDIKARLPRGGVGASQVNPAFTVSHREKAALQWLKGHLYNEIPRALKVEAESLIHEAECIMAGKPKGKVKSKKTFDF